MNELLKTRLIELKEADFNFELVEDKESFTMELLGNIGDEDPYVRDDLVYPALARLLYRDHLSDAVLIDIFKLLHSKSHLFYGIGGIDLNVLTRTFSSLQIAVLLYKHNQKSFIPRNDILEYFKVFMEYYYQEEDLRGFLEEEGWAHSVAHAADVLKQYAQASELDTVDLELMLTGIKSKFMQCKYNFINNEDERTVSAIELMLQRELLTDQFMREWILSFKSYEKQEDYKKEFIINNNIKCLLRSLYFRVDKYQNIIREVLDEINPNKKVD